MKKSSNIVLQPSKHEVTFFHVFLYLYHISFEDVLSKRYQKWGDLKKDKSEFNHIEDCVQKESSNPLHTVMMIRTWGKVLSGGILLTDKCKNLNTINVNISPHHGGIYTVKRKFNKYSEDKILRSLKKYITSYPVRSVLKDCGVIPHSLYVDSDLRHC